VVPAVVAELNLPGNMSLMNLTGLAVDMLRAPVSSKQIGDVEWSEF
jgi:hypothetical protein